MFFKRKDEQIGKPNPKQILKEKLLKRCRENTNNILTKLEVKYNESLPMIKEGKFEEVKSVFKRIHNYLEGMDWENKIDQALENTDEEVAIYCLQLAWSSLMEDINNQISFIITLLEKRKEEKNGK